jgi:hypothetical protein
MNAEVPSKEKHVLICSAVKTLLCCRKETSEKMNTLVLKVFELGRSEAVI